MKRTREILNFLHNHYVKVRMPKGNTEWFDVFLHSKSNVPVFIDGRLSGASLKTGNVWYFSPSDVVAFYEGDLKEAAGLGMPYIPTAEVCTILDTIVPDSMGYETHIACRVVQEIVGKPLSEWVSEKLHYSELELCKALSAEQVDAVALCIYNIEYKKQGMIIGDQTGIGKGRVAAAMIRYGYYNGLKPVFITEKPNLFSDIYRDIIDIGSDDGIAKEFSNEEPQKRKIHFKKWAKLTEEEQEEFENENAYNEYINEPENQYEYVYKRVKNKNFDLEKGNRLIPFIINGKQAKTNIIDNNGNLIYTGLEKTENNNILESKKIPELYNCVLMTYSQVTSKKQQKKRDFLRAITKDNLIIMDEAHNASGSSNTGEFLQEILIGCKGVVFLSATFAKRPDNMPVYALKTCVSEANMTSEELVEAIIKGGVALQEVLASQLVSEGQMLRRERSFEGVEVNYTILTEKEQEHKAIFDNITSVLRDIIEFQDKYVTKVVDQLDKIAAAEGKEVEERKGTSHAGVDNSPYFSKVFQVINQILFSLKARSVAEIAIERLKEGKKPIIAFASTMESFFDDMTNERGTPVMAGDTVNIDFKNVLQKGLDGVMRYTVTDIQGNRVGKYFTVAELKPEGQEFYKQITNKINDISTGISISPIDVIKDIIRKAGFTCDEVTGRQTELQIIENSHNAVLLARKKILANDAFRMFNNNELDCLLINQSGATGASAHAIVTPKVPAEKVKQRVMIILQPELDINKEVQKRGRINRTGQIMKPIYDYVSSCIPAENRLMMMLRRKLKSLDANTTSNQKQSDNILQVDDFLNKYGDKLVTEYLQELPELNEILGDPLKMKGENKEGKTLENAASKVSGRVAVLSTEQQEKFYTEILERYNDYVNYLKQADQYDLEVQELNLQAETTDTQVVIEGKNGKSVFSENTNLETCQINVLKKPFTHEELKNILEENLQGRDGKEIQTEVLEQAKTFYANRLALDIEKLQKKYDALIEDIPNEKAYEKAVNKELFVRERTKELEGARQASIEKENETSENKFYNISNILNFFYPAKALNYPTFMQESVKAVCLGYNIDKKKDNPFAPSAIKIKIAIANSDKYIDLTLSGEPGKKLMEIMGFSTYIQKSEQTDLLKNWEYYCRNSTGSRRQAYIITGNILQAFAKYTGKLISYTTSEGGIKKGILLPENFDPAKQGRGMITVPIIKAIDFILAMPEDSIVFASDDKIRIEKYASHGERNYRITLPANKNYKDMFEDRKIIKLSNNDRDGFEKRGTQMVAFFQTDSIKPLLAQLQEVYNLSVSISPSVYDEYIEKKQTTKSVKTQLVNKAEKKYEEDKANFENRKTSTPPVAADKKKKELELLKLKMKMKALALKLIKY